MVPKILTILYEQHSLAYESCTAQLLKVISAIRIKLMQHFSISLAQTPSEVESEGTMHAVVQDFNENICQRNTNIIGVPRPFYLYFISPRKKYIQA